MTSTKKRILVVENNKDILGLISIILDGAGYEYCLLPNELNIFNRIVEFNPNAILLDIIRPTIEGTELCRLIKEAETTKHIPIIVLSTHPKVENVKDICADEVVEKPFDIDDLLGTIEEQLSEAS